MSETGPGRVLESGRELNMLLNEELRSRLGSILLLNGAEISERSVLLTERLLIAESSEDDAGSGSENSVLLLGKLSDPVADDAGEEKEEANEEG